jgi:DNA primase
VCSSDLDDGMPKYMNSPETAVYNKGRHLYALNFAKNSDEKRLVVVEGYMDVISLHQSGITNAVATLGTALTESQGRVLKKYAEEIIISYDADTAGQAATIRGLDVLSEIGCSVRVLTVPDGKDPDEYVRRNGPEGFRKLVDGSLSLVEYKIRAAKKEQDTGTLEGRLAFLNKVAVILSKIDNTVEREMYIRKISKEYEISEESMLAEVLKKLRPRASAGAKPVNAPAAARRAQAPEGTAIDERLLHDERFVLSLLCVDNSIYKNIKGMLDVGIFSDGENRRLAKVVIERLENGREISPAELLSMTSGENAGEYARIFNEECHCDDNNRVILGKIRSIDIYRTEKRQKQILELLKDKSHLPEGDVEKLELELKKNLLKISGKKS